MARSRRVSWTCPICSRVFLRDVVIARAQEIEPPKRSRGLDSPCPNCGFLDLVLPDAPGDVVIAVTTTPAEHAPLSAGEPGGEAVSPHRPVSVRVAEAFGGTDRKPE